MTKEKNTFLNFAIDSIEMALPIEKVIKIVPFPKLLQLPNLPQSVLGLLNYKGELFPVFDLRIKYNLPHQKINIDQYVLLGCTDDFRFGILTDRIFNHIDNINSIETTDKILLNGTNKSQFFKHDDGVIFLSNPKEFLSVEEIDKISQVLNSTEHQENE